MQHKHCAEQQKSCQPAQLGDGKIKGAESESERGLEKG